ncbi:MAG: glycoside hydrolase family 27 protein [Planctomycetota bacterium]|nr:glycoside hydrolase family 27 protein [Planctomycetota bacterium]MCX8040497.1 glycoside hydrolase family 27 protein [Planctomycetota bacterium]MDW8373503.1 glycoside hydrolase family 27 protein [Planctomycetota bacterium]
MSEGGRRRAIRGWNSWDCYGMYVDEAAVLRQAEAMARCLLPAGYRYLTIDSGWHGNRSRLAPPALPYGGRDIPLVIDAHGRYLPSPELFPRGIAFLAERLRARGLVLGIHLMRGVPREAAEDALPIEGGDGATCADIADRRSLCVWNNWNYGVADTPAGQAYYDSVIRLVASWGVGYIKYDDITEHPSEMRMLAHAVRRIAPHIVLSLSPGGGNKPEYAACYNLADAVRVTADFWDKREDLVKCVDRAVEILGWGSLTTAIDLDMLPFGQLRISTPRPANATVDPLEGWARWSQLSYEAQRHAMALRAVVGSPLIMGGDLCSLDARTLELLTHPRIIECHDHQHEPAVTHDEPGQWAAFRCRDRRGGFWMAIVNRSERALTIDRPLIYPGAVLDAWTGATLHAVQRSGRLQLELPAEGAAFLRLLPVS